GASPLLRGGQIRSRLARPPAFRFSPDPAGASGEPSSRPSGGLPPWGTAGEPTPRDAGERGRGRQSGSRPESARRLDSKSIRPRRPSPPSLGRGSSHDSRL